MCWLMLCTPAECNCWWWHAAECPFKASVGLCQAAAVAEQVGVPGPRSETTAKPTCQQLQQQRNTHCPSCSHRGQPLSHLCKRLVTPEPLLAAATLLPCVRNRSCCCYCCQAADLGGLYLPVPQDLCGEGTQQRLPLVCWAAQVLHPVAMAHHGPLHD